MDDRISLTKILAGVTGAWLILSVIVLVLARNPNVLLAMAVIFVALVIATGTVAAVQGRKSRSWRKAVRQTKWTPAQRRSGADATVVLLERVAYQGDRAVELDRPITIATIPDDLDVIERQVQVTQAWHAAESRASIENYGLRSRS